MEKAYENLRFYQNIVKVRDLTFEITGRFTKVHLRLISQMNDAARSAKQNIREGYKKGSAGEFGNSIRISRGSLEELEGDYEDCFKYKLITQDEFKILKRLFKEIDYQSNRYLFSLYKMDKEGKWKVPYRDSPKPKRRT